VRDYKPRPKAKPTNIGNTLLGIFIGLLVGLLVAAAIAIYMMKSPFPWSSKSRLSDRSAASEAKASESERANAGKSSAEDSKVAKAGEKSDKPRFDFYRILPGQDGGAAGNSVKPPLPADTVKGETPKGEPARAEGGKAEAAGAEAAKAEGGKADAGKTNIAKADGAKADGAKADSTASRNSFVLQAGAFQNPAEADNVKAKLALLGLESNIETVDLPDRGTWYRVRMGPYKSLNEVNHIRSQLAQSGIDVSLVRNNPSP
jgi:cell division protein FtsN